MIRSLLLLAWNLVSFSQVGFSQGRVITGRVTNAKTGNPVEGATVKVKGTNAATITSPDGSYSIAVPGNDAVLVVSGVGFTEKEFAVGANNQLDLGVEE